MSIANIIVGGLLLGIAGSFHCIGMCGPLIMMLHGQIGQNTSTKWMLLHHLGRMTAYVLLAIIFYSLGKYSGMFQLQQGASLFGGLLLILGWIPITQRWLSKWLTPLRNKIKINEIQTPYIKHFLWGIFNGTLPCGWVYSAIGASLISGHLLHSVLFMIWLWSRLNTIPFSHCYFRKKNSTTHTASSTHVGSLGSGHYRFNVCCKRSQLGYSLFEPAT